MEKKRAALERLDVGRPSGKAPDHRYRYRANLGTFHAHRWLGRGAPADDLADLERGRDLVAAAIRDNPDAHFGREKYQLKAMTWLLGRPRMPSDDHRPLPTFIEIGPGTEHAISDNDQLAKTGQADALAGISGLITLGAAWNSVDVTAALAYALAVDGKHRLLEMARLRIADLLGASQRSLVVGAPEGSALLERLPHPLLEEPSSVREEYEKLKRQAAQWHEARTSYLEQGLARGDHPDVKAAFWDAFEGHPEHMGTKGKPLSGLPSRRSCGCRSVAPAPAEPTLAAIGLALAVAIGRRRAVGRRNS